MPIEQTTDKIRIQVKDPSLFVQDSIRTVILSEEEGIESVMGKLLSDPEGSMVVQNYMFDKKKWTVSEAEAWVDKHKRQAGMEKRSFDTNLRISFEDRNLTKLIGMAIPYGILSNNPIKEMPNVKERILPGAFKRSITDGHDVMMFWNHEPKYIFGRTSKGTLQLHDTNDGVNFENIPPDAQWVKDLIPSIKRGDISNMSFGFRDTVEPSWTKENGQYVRNVREAYLGEISLVTNPVYESSTVFMRNSDLMIVDGIVLDCTSDEKRIELERAKDERFDNLLNQFESLKKEWT